MQATWHRIVEGADPFLDGLTTPDLERRSAHDQRLDPPTVGSQLQYVTYHYWSHIGEASAVRQLLGHAELAEYVGDLPPDAEYRREA
jgi:hypothetical protein